MLGPLERARGRPRGPEGCEGSLEGSRGVPSSPQTGNISGNFSFLAGRGYFEKDYWRITAAHDGYLKDYKSIHERNIEFYPEKMIFVGNDKIIKRKTKNNYKFEIRFHLEPNIKLMKTQDKKSILIELDEE